MNALEKRLVAADCEVAFDNLTRQLFASDASLYQIQPRGVAYPRNPQQARSIINAAVDAGFQSFRAARAVDFPAVRSAMD